jgi:DNA repair protein RadC
VILKEVPYNERPREKLLLEGSTKLSNIELLAILLRTGTKDDNVLEVAKKVIYLLEDITDLQSLTIQELTKIKGIGESKAITILASVELGRRITEYKQKKLIFTNPESIFEYFYPRMKDLDQEYLYVIYLDLKSKVIAIKNLTIGTISSTLIDANLIFKWAYKLSASGFILIHNHPSGDENPSKTDLKVTEEIFKQSKTLGLFFLDHIIIGNYYFSIKEETSIFK